MRALISIADPGGSLADLLAFSTLSEQQRRICGCLKLGLRRAPSKA